MNHPGDLGPWDDDRLEKSFVALAAAHHVDTELADRTVAAVRAASRNRTVRGWARFAPAMAATSIVLVVIVGLVVTGPGWEALHTPDTTPIHPSVQPSNAESTRPEAVLGMRVISVTDAIAVRDAGADDRELAVRGWYTPVPPSPCPYTPATSPVQPVCPDDWVILMRDPESVVTRLGNGFEGRAPVGPSLHIDLDDLDTSWAPLASSEVGPSSPIEVVIVGHFDDRRSFACPAAEVDACRDRFIVDRVDWADGRSLLTSAFDLVDGGAESTAAEVEATVRETVRGAEVLSMVAVDGEFGLQRIEPSIGVFAQLQGQRAIWVVRLLDRCVIRCTARGVGEFGTYLVVDGTDALFKVDADNVATQVAGTLPVPSPVPWPPDGATIVELTNGEGQEPARVAVVDLSGQLVEARAHRADDSSLEGPDEGLFRDPTVNHQYRMRWTTTICDREMTVTIHAEVERIVIGHAPRDGCDAMGVGRELVLEFASDLDPADVTFEVVPAELLPEPPPEPTTMFVELIRGDTVEEVVVIDHAGSLMEARPADLADVPAEIGLAGGTRLARVDDGGTVVLWDGGLCDRDISITIEADDLGPPDRIIVRSVRSAQCRLALVRRAVWLDLGPVNVSTIVVRHDVSVASTGQDEVGPQISVVNAMVIQSHANDHQQLVVRGWFWRDPTIYDCFLPPSLPPALEPGCHGPHNRLLADAADPTGPGLTVWLRPLANGDVAFVPFDDPVDVVLVGHFDDPMAETCGASTRDACRDVFVVEEVLRPQEASRVDY